MPKRAKTVSLLASLALRSPTSPLPFNGLAKCMVIAALEPPAEIEQRDLKTALRHKEATRSPGTGKAISRGESVSRITAVSFRTSASKRYVFASGYREEPKKWADKMA